MGFEWDDYWVVYWVDDLVVRVFDLLVDLTADWMVCAMVDVKVVKLESNLVVV